MTEMTPFKELISYEEALKKILKTIKPMQRIETISIGKASDRVLAEDIVAQMSLPPFDRAAMDGYAVKAEDTFGATQRKPKSLRVRGVLHAGQTSSEILTKDECIQIATGSPIPKGADAVVMVEFTHKENGNVNIARPVYPGANISPRGEDIEEGKMILEAGQQLSPARIGALAALGRKEVGVYQKPRITVVPTGTEIQEVGSSLKEGHIYDVNSYTLSSIAAKSGGIPKKYKTVLDTPPDIEEAIKKMLTTDMIVFSGGSSVGERDLLVNVIEELGNILFHGIQIKPGKPTLFATIEEKPVFGMPGYPTSCLLNAYLFLVPGIRQMARLPPRIPITKRLPLAERVVSSTGRTQFLPVKIKEEEAYPVFKQSGAITSMTEADGYIILPINVDIAEKNQKFNVFLFD